MVEAVSNESGDNGPGQDVEFGKGEQATSTMVLAISSSFLTDVTKPLGRSAGMGKECHQKRIHSRFQGPRKRS